MVSNKKGRKVLRGVIPALLLLAVTGCASIPLGTMIRMARFGVEDLQKVDPGEIRAALRTHHEFDLKNASLTIKIGLADGGEILMDEVYELERMPNWAARSYELKPPPSDRHWIVFRLASEDLQRFAGMQQQLVEISKDERGKSMTLGVGSQDNDNPVGFERVPFAVDLRLAEADGFFTLIKETELDLGRTTPLKTNSLKHRRNASAILSNDYCQGQISCVGKSAAWGR